TYASGWTSASIAAHRSLSLPLQLVGEVHRWSTRYDDQVLRILGIGRRKLLEPLCSGVVGELPPPTQEARRALWSPPQLAGENADLVIVEIHRWMASRFKRLGWRIVPSAVRWEGDLAVVPPARPCASLRDDLRKVRQHGYVLTQSQDPEDWTFFYQEMVRPHAHGRYGPAAWHPSPRFIKQLARVATLHFVTRNGERVAGLCSVARGETVWFPLSGILGGDLLLLHQGAGAAATALTLDWARARGFRRVDNGRTSPFLEQGLARYKRKWGLLPVPDPLAHLAAIAVRSPLAGKAFARNPVLVEEGNALITYSGETG
ncbi:MAG TPA: GNAT family N-acetyltransferase, partial [Gemmatimonadales bacterium]|nr:GNAT family N-acetyltransferase [Gemmatimonadales bacterium]